MIKLKKTYNYKFIKVLIGIFILLNIAFFYISSLSISKRYELMLSQSISNQLTVVEDFFRYPENIINILSQNKDLQTYEANNRFLRNDILSLFESIVISDTRISNIYFISNDGGIISYKFLKSSSMDFSGMNWYKKTMDAKAQFTWTSHKSDFTNGDVISCTRRVIDKYNKPIGIVGLDIELFKLSDLVRNIEVAKSGYFMILDDEYKIIASKDYNKLGQIISDSTLYKNINGGTKNSYILRLNNQKYISKVSKIEELPWTVVNVIPNNEINKSLLNSIVMFILLSVTGFTIITIMFLKNKFAQDLNHKLKNANEKLKEYASTIKEVAILQERNRLARDVHDTLGQTLSILITLLQVCILSCKKDSKETEENLNKAIKITREGLNEVRRSISGLVSETLKEKSFMESLEKLVNDFECSGLHIELTVNILDPSIDIEYKEVIYRVCQEALTNSVKHGKATEVNIIIKFTDDLIKLFIFDNGIGCKNVGSTNGFGLKGMKQRIEELNGDLKFGSSENGFNIHVELPLTIEENGVHTYDKSHIS